MKKILIVLLALVLLLTSCGTNATPAPEPQPTPEPQEPPPPALPSPTPDQAPEGFGLYDMEFDLADASGIESHTFRLDPVDLTAANGAVIPGPVDGTVAVPQTPGPHPLVVVIHGASLMAHANIHHNTHAGFDFLLEQLAAQGYVAVSINVNANYAFEIGEPAVQDGFALDTFDRHLALLEQANAGESTGHGVDITGKIDFSEIHLIGHSRGGEVAETLLIRDQNDGGGAIRSLLRIAPTTSPRGSQPDVPFAIVLPEYDGDVSQLEGQLVFDQIFSENQNESFGQLVYLRGAGHNFFTRAFESDDREGESSIADNDDRATWLSRGEHETFIKHYAAAFLAVVAGQREPWGSFNVLEPQPATLFGFAATVSSYIPGNAPLIALPAQTTFSITTVNSASASFYLQSIPAEEVGHGLFNHPMVPGRQDPKLPLYAIAWDRDDGAVIFPVLETDLSRRGALSIFMAVDAADDRNPTRAEQSFSVVLTDKAGNTQSVVVPPGTNALKAHPGHKEDHHILGNIWIGHTPLGELRVPLRYFDEIDLTAIESFGLRFDQTDTGAIMLSGAYIAG